MDMAQSDWSRVKELFQSALEVDPGGRAEFLDQSCTDCHTRDQVEKLLRNYEEADRFFADPVVNRLSGGDTAAQTPDSEPISDAVSEADSPEPEEPMTGRRVGAYRVVRRIGQGGMAAVFLAMRDDDAYQKQVAIKLVMPGRESRELLDRFRNERQTLAALDHPNIVKLLDGGSTPEGSPYLVMDYVEGSPIDDYCDRHKLTIDKRLQLFLKVCDAVQYAHHKSVVHRDLKPSNILVTEDGTPKVLDFGIAKVLGPTEEMLAFTQTGGRCLTPAYASPEQVQGRLVTTATDIYSLGVVLYEVLTGLGPYRLTEHTPSEIERAVCEQIPEAPSAALGRSRSLAEGRSGSADLVSGSATLPRRGECESEGRDNLRRRLRGDLDNIVLKALRKEPELRYESVKDLARDIGFHLDHLPITARPPSLRYQTAKLLRRHMGKAIAGILMLLMLFAATMLTRWEMRRTAAIREAPLHEAQSIGRPSLAILGFHNLSARPDTAWVSTALSEMLTTELAAGGKLRTIPGENVAQAKINLSLPETDTLSRQTLGRIYDNLGSDLVVLGSYLDVGDPARNVRLDLRVQEATSGETVAVVSENGSERALPDLVARSGAALREMLGLPAVSPAESPAVQASAPSNPEATRLYAEGLARLRAFDALAARDLLQKSVAADPSYALAHAMLAEAYSKLGLDINATNEAKRAFDLRSSLSREESLLVEARYMRATGQWDREIEIYRTLFNFFPDELDYGLHLAAALLSADKEDDVLKAVESMRKLHSPMRDDPRIDLYESYAAHALGDFKLSQAASARAAEKARARGAKLIVASALYHETWALVRLGQLKQAASTASQSKDIYEAAGDEFGASDAMEATGNVLAKQGDVTGAIRAYQESLQIERKIGRKDGEAASLNNVAECFHKEGRLAEARRMYEQSLEIWSEIDDKENAATTMTNIANVLDDEGDVAGAAEMYRRSLSFSRETGSKSGVALALLNLGETLVEQGNLALAEKNYREALRLSRKTGDRPGTADALFDLGELYKLQGDLAKARQQHSQALTIRNSMGAQAGIAESRMMLAALSVEEGHAVEVLDPLREEIETFRQRKLREDELGAHVVLANALLAVGKRAEAQKEIDLGSELAANSESRGARLHLSIVAARIRAARGQPPDFIEAGKSLNATLAEARQCGIIGYQFEARLALGEMEMKSGHLSAGRARLRALEEDAKRKGFGLIERKAGAVRG
jgi:serine/threonine protein kinase/tetratricopeptide (TPR) repeat protein